MLQDTINRARLTWRLLRDERVPISFKAVPIFAIIYAISPIDLIPFFPIDDIAIVLFAMQLFIDSVPEGVVNEHRRALGIALKDGQS